jgi:hypothetical protein
MPMNVFSVLLFLSVTKKKIFFSIEDHLSTNKANEYRRLSNEDKILFHIEYENEYVIGNGYLLYDIKALTNDTRDKEVFAKNSISNVLT